MDEDLDAMTRDELVAEAKRLRDGIRAHRDGTGHQLCWHHPALWGLLPDRTDPVPVVPGWPQFLEGCIRYRRSLDEQAPPCSARRNRSRVNSADRGSAGRVTRGCRGVGGRRCGGPPTGVSQ